MGPTPVPQHAARTMTSGGREPDGLPDGDRTARRAAAFGALVAAHTDRLCKFVYRYVGSREVAEDIVQDVFIRLWERGDELQVRDPLPYLYQAARNGALSYLRHAQVHERWQLRSGVPAERGHPPETANVEVERTDLALALERGIAELPERCRQVFTMSREQGLTYAEIARVLGLSVKTVESHVWRAMTALRARVAPYL
jgi:RNA polymerase sigma-70 factor, ECF subfamily